MNFGVKANTAVAHECFSIFWKTICFTTRCSVRFSFRRKRWWKRWCKWAIRISCMESIASFGSCCLCTIYQSRCVGLNIACRSRVLQTQCHWLFLQLDSLQLFLTLLCQQQAILSLELLQFLIHFFNLLLALFEQIIFCNQFCLVLFNLITLSINGKVGSLMENRLL